MSSMTDDPKDERDARGTKQGLGTDAHRAVEAQRVPEQTKLRSPVAQSAPPPAPSTPQSEPSVRIVPNRPAQLEGWELCPHCRVYTPTARFCSACGMALGALRLCAGCGFRHGPKAKFCENCGREAD